jgi:DNA-binding transcriptional LysR family regulator
VRQELPSVMRDLRGGPLTPAQVALLIDGTLDLRLLRPPVHERGLSTEVLRSEPLVAVLPESHPLAESEAVPIELLRDTRFVTDRSHFRSYERPRTGDRGDRRGGRRPPARERRVRVASRGVDPGEAKMRADSTRRGR